MLNVNNPYNPYGDLPEIPGWEQMTDEEREQAIHTRILCSLLVWPVAMAVLLLLCLLFGSCATKDRVVVQEHYRTDTLYQVRDTRDSIYLHDSIHVSDFTRGDTVWRIRDRWHTQYVERTRTDTLYQSRTDTLTQVRETIREVPARLTWWQQVRINVGGVAVWLVVIVGGVWVWRKLRTIK